VGVGGLSGLRIGKAVEIEVGGGVIEASDASSAVRTGLLSERCWPTCVEDWPGTAVRRLRGRRRGTIGIAFFLAPLRRAVRWAAKVPGEFQRFLWHDAGFAIGGLFGFLRVDSAYGAIICAVAPFARFGPCSRSGGLCRGVGGVGDCNGSRWLTFGCLPGPDAKALQFSL